MVLHGCACVYNCRQVVRGIPARCALLYGVLCLQEPPANCIACVGFHKKCAGLTRAVARFDCALCQVQPANCLVGWILRMRLYVFMRAPWNRDVCRKGCLRARIRCGCIRSCFVGSGWVGRAALAGMQSVWCWTVLPRKKGRRNLFVRTVLVGCLLCFVIVVGARRMSPRLGRKYSVLSYACPFCLPWSNRQDVVGSQQAMVSLGPNS